MKKYRRLSEGLEAANQVKNSAMDAQNHVKHGASSKNRLISRGNFVNANLKQYWFLLVLGCFLTYGCFNNIPKATSFYGLPVIDLTKEYPEKDFFVGDDHIEHVLLETTNEVLVDERFFVKYVSENRIVGFNFERGDIFVFGADGKIISSFNHTGNSGIDYIRIHTLVFDESRKEIFVSDGYNRRLVVYSEDGKFLRQLNYPDNIYIGLDNLFNYDDQTLLAYNRPQQRFDADDVNQKMPYVFLSKEDGSVVSRIDLSFPVRIADDRHREISPDHGSRVFSVATNNIVKHGQEFIIADRSSDTIYLLTQDKNLTPLFVRTPSVFDTDRVIYLSVHFKTDRYIFFGTSSYDFTRVVERFREGQPYGHLFTTRNLVFDLQTGQIFSAVRSPRFTYIVDAPINTNVRWFSAGRLIDLLEEGSLDGRKLKEIAEAIMEEEEEVNPVVEIAIIR